MRPSETKIIARDAFAEIASHFPSLKMVENRDDPVEISITLPIQQGLSHKIWLCLQNQDELGFGVEHFYVEFFPCTESVRVRRYLDAVIGFLSGEYRILEYYRGKTCYKAVLQKPEEDQWCTIATWGQLWFPMFSKKSVRELRNRPTQP